jgi:hypothetical protein
MDPGLAKLRARSIVDALGFKNPEAIDIEAIAMLRGLVCISEAVTGAEGRLVRGAAGGVIRAGSGTKNEGRRRFTIAHGIGHYELHGDKNRTSCSAADLDAWGESAKEEEYQASVFAAELLMPERLFAPRCRGVRPCLEYIESLARLFRTSLTATGIRFVEFCPEECAIVFSQDKTIRWGYPGGEFRFKYIPPGDKLSALTLAYDYFHGRSADQRQQSVDASAWFPKIRFRQDAMLKEQSWRLGDYGGVLTLLWIDHDI